MSHIVEGLPGIFQFDCHPIRVHLDKEHEPWFVAVDVCHALGIKNSSQAMTILPDEVKRTARTYRLEQNVGITQTYGVEKPYAYNVKMITSSGLTRLIARSEKPTAKKMQDWIHDEVLPSIRRTGKYESLTNPLIQIEHTTPSVKVESPSLPTKFDFLDQVDVIGKRINHWYEKGVLSQEDAQSLMTKALRLEGWLD